MYPKKMERVEIFLMKGDLDRVIVDLQDSRTIQSIEVEGNKEGSVDPKLLDLRADIERIIDLLVPLEEPLSGLKSILRGKCQVYRTSKNDDLSKTRNWIRSTRSRVGPLEDEIRRVEGDIDHLSETISRLTQLSGLNIDLNTLSSFRRVRIKIGTTRRFDELQAAVKGVGGDIDGSLIDRKEGLHSVRIAYTSSMEKDLGEILRGRLYTEMNIDVPGIRKFISMNNMDMDILNLSIGRLLPKLDSLKDELDYMLEGVKKEGSIMSSELLPPARAHLEMVEMKVEKERFNSSLLRTRYTRRIVGWIEKDRLQELKDILTKRCPNRHHMDRRPPTEDEIKENIVPTKLNNGWLGTMFEPLTNTFAIPKYNEIDPSLMISVPFIFFFGLMLGDAGYGMIIMVLSFLLIYAGRSNRSLKMTGWMGFLMGLATTVSGIWMGAFFGDLIPRVVLGNAGSPLYTFELFGYQMPYDTLKDPMLLFQVSLYIGLIQLNLGILLYGIDKLVKRDIFGFFKGTVSWFLIQVGSAIFIGAMLIGWWELDTLLTAIGGGSFILGTVLLVFKSKGMVLFDIEGYLGDWISYTRILALGLSTFGLAMAFNIVGRMLLESHLAMIPVAFLLLAFLHVFNLLLQALGAGVHSLRLQFVEFFGRFYEGGGIPFEPFGMERVHTKIVTRNKRTGSENDVI